MLAAWCTRPEWGFWSPTAHNFKRFAERRGASTKCDRALHAVVGPHKSSSVTSSWLPGEGWTVRCSGEHKQGRRCGLHGPCPGLERTAGRRGGGQGLPCMYWALAAVWQLKCLVGGFGERYARGGSTMEGNAGPSCSLSRSGAARRGQRSRGPTTLRIQRTVAASGGLGKAAPRAFWHALEPSRRAGLPLFRRFGGGAATSCPRSHILQYIADNPTRPRSPQFAGGVPASARRFFAAHEHTHMPCMAISVRMSVKLCSSCRRRHRRCSSAAPRRCSEPRPPALPPAGSSSPQAPTQQQTWTPKRSLRRSPAC